MNLLNIFICKTNKTTPLNVNKISARFRKTNRYRRKALFLENKYRNRSRFIWLVGVGCGGGGNGHRPRRPVGDRMMMVMVVGRGGRGGWLLWW